MEPSLNLHSLRQVKEKLRLQRRFLKASHISMLHKVWGLSMMSILTVSETSIPEKSFTFCSLEKHSSPSLLCRNGILYYGQCDHLPDWNSCWFFQNRRGSPGPPKTVDSSASCHSRQRNLHKCLLFESAGVICHHGIWQAHPLVITGLLNWKRALFFMLDSGSFSCWPLHRNIIMLRNDTYWQFTLPNASCSLLNSSQDFLTWLISSEYL